MSPVSARKLAVELVVNFDSVKPIATIELKNHQLLINCFYMYRGKFTIQAYNNKYLTNKIGLIVDELREICEDLNIEFHVVV